MPGDSKHPSTDMRPRAELAVLVAALSALVVLAGVAGSRERRTGNEDPRASSLRDGPRGLKGLADVISASGGRASASRTRFGELLDRAADTATIIIANPAQDLSIEEVTQYFAARPDALIAGLGAEPIMRCVGYETSPMVLDSTRVTLYGRAAASDVWAHAVLAPLADSLRVLSAPFGAQVPCPEIVLTSVDTLLVDEEAHPVMLRLAFGARPTTLTLLAEERLLDNATLRRSALAPQLVGFVTEPNRDVMFDEFHQGFGPGGSLGGVVLAWSRTHPIGWLIWQLVSVGAIAFFTGAVRFGPVTAAIQRQRRSSREHVTALATALASARGHDVAIGSLVSGLRRRLRAAPREGSRGGQASPPTADRVAWEPWVRSLAERASSPEARERAQRLLTFASPNQPNAAVRTAANVVEDVWEALHR
jgi:hypothetical protein